jgi:hypothetical protein
VISIVAGTPQQSTARKNKPGIPGDTRSTECND